MNRKIVTGAGIPPWHLWGGTQTIGPQPLTLLDDGLRTRFTAQLAKVSYKRPDSWHWLFAARVLDAPNAVLDDQVIIEVGFDVIIGIGRAQYTIQNFERFNWQWGPSSTAPINREEKWSTTVLCPAKRFNEFEPPFTPDDTTSTLTTSFVAQDIQLNCRVGGMRSTAVGTFKVEVSAFLAPVVHIRPEWELERFPGGEHQ